ncbi:FtsK/SpoIIIE domain-containing protein, partial [Streptococcus suis]
MEKDNLLLEPVYYSLTTGTVLVIGLGLVFILNQLGYLNLLVFSKWNNLRIMANFLLENGYYTTKKFKRDKQVQE